MAVEAKGTGEPIACQDACANGARVGLEGREGVVVVGGGCDGSHRISVSHLEWGLIAEVGGCCQWEGARKRRGGPVYAVRRLACRKPKLFGLGAQYARVN